MALLKNWQGSLDIMRSLVILFVCWLGWFSTFVLAQFDISEGVTGSVNNFPTLGITCVGSSAVFVTTLIRGRLDLEIGARDVLDILLSRKLEKIKRVKHGYGLTTFTEEEDATIAGGGADKGTTSRKGVPQTASTQENDIQTASTGGGPEAESLKRAGHQIGSTEREAVRDASTRRPPTVMLSKETPKRQSLHTASVLILSNGTPNWSMKQFMKSNAQVVDSILLQFLRLQLARDDAKVRDELTSQVSLITCPHMDQCHCIVFWTVEEITRMLASRMPRTFKRLSDSLCLLPCSACLRNGCHGCNLEAQVDERQTMRESVVSDILKDIPAGKPICICLPLNDSRHDNWTELLVRSLRSKDAEGRGVRNMASEALEGYLAGGRGREEGTVEYDIFSFVVPRLTEVFINLVLTFWFRVDGFSSALVARRTVRDYVVDSKSSGFVADAFLTQAMVKSNADNSQVCQVLTFRNCDGLCIITFISVGFVNLICTLGWALLISFEGGPDASQPPTMPIVAIIIAAIGAPWVMQLMIFFSVSWSTSSLWDIMLHCLRVWSSPISIPWLLIRKALTKDPSLSYVTYADLLISAVVAFDTVCFLSWSIMAVTLGIKCFGKWLYGALQIMVWLKWAMGSYVLNVEKSVEFFGRNPTRQVILFRSYAFLLNAVLAGVRCKWEAWPWKHNHLFSRNRVLKLTN